jgi:DNA-binding beta-propeller fold protein YncE
MVRRYRVWLPTSGRAARCGGLAFAVFIALGACAGGAAGSSFTAYVTRSGSGLGGTLTPVETATNSAEGPIVLHHNPTAIAITPDGTTAYVVYPASGIRPITLATGTVGGMIPLTNPGAIAITPDSETAYVTAFGEVRPITLATETRQAPIRVGSDPDAIAITPDGTTAFVANAGSGTVTPITLATNTPQSPISVGADPDAIAVTADGTTAYVANAGSATVTPITLATNTPQSPISVGQDPTAIAISPDGATAYVTDIAGVTPITIATNTRQRTIPVPGGAHAIAITPDGMTAYVVSPGANGVTPIALATDTLGTPIPIGGAVAEIAINPLPGRQTSTSIDCSPQSVALLVPTACTVTVTDVDAGTALTPTGMVNLTTLYTFYENRNARPAIAPGFFGGPCTLSGSGASATCQTTYTPTRYEGGLAPISADYSGDGTHATSSASTPVTVVLRSTTTSLTCAQSMLTVGEPTTCTASVTDTAHGQTSGVGGTVTFSGSKNDRFTPTVCKPYGFPAATCQTTYTPTSLGTGSHTITATYTPYPYGPYADHLHTPSSGSTTVSVSDS